MKANILSSVALVIINMVIAFAFLARIAQEGTGTFRMLTAVFVMIGLVIALCVPFNVLMNYICVINGYLGFVVLAIMLVKMAIMFCSRKSA